MAAIVADTRRADELPSIQARTLVLHGKDDPLVPMACGHDTAPIPGVAFVTIDGMGHDLPPGGPSNACSSRWCRTSRQTKSMNTPEQSQLAKPAALRRPYDASLLFPLSRQPKRVELGCPGPCLSSAPTCGPLSS